MTILRQLARQAIRYGLKPEEIGPASTFTDLEFMRCYIGHLQGLESPASFGVSDIHRDRARKAWAKVFAEMKQGAAK
jgi:hypothetical protein